MDKKLFCFIFLFSFICGCLLTGTAGYFIFVRSDRSALAASRAEAAEYRSRAEFSENRLRECTDIITTGEGKLSNSIGTIQQAILQIREIRKILSDLKQKLTVQELGDGG